MRRYTARIPLFDRVGYLLCWLLIAASLLYSTAMVGSMWASLRLASGLPGVCYIRILHFGQGFSTLRFSIAGAVAVFLVLTTVSLAAYTTLIWYLWHAHRFIMDLGDRGWVVDGERIILPRLSRSEPQEIRLEDITEVAARKPSNALIWRPPVIIAGGKMTPIHSYLERHDDLLNDIVERAGLSETVEDDTTIRYRRPEG